MSGEPWDVPETEEGRDTLERLAAEYEAAGQLREYGITLTRLARLVLQVGPREGTDNGWVGAAKVGRRAVEVLRQTDDKRALAAALRIAAQPMVAGIDREALLDEAEQIAREIEDWSAVGWAIFAKS